MLGRELSALTSSDQPCMHAPGLTAASCLQQLKLQSISWALLCACQAFVHLQLKSAAMPQGATNARVVTSAA